METPVVSYEDWGGIVKNFGISIGQFFGTGCEGMPLLIRAVKDLLADADKRKSLGKAGRAYVEETHNDEIFLKHFEIILKGIQK